MTNKTTNMFSPEVRARAARIVLDQANENASHWAAVTSISANIGCTPQALHWFKAEIDSGQRAGVPVEMTDKMKALEWENRELRQTN